MFLLAATANDVSGGLNLSLSNIVTAMQSIERQMEPLSLAVAFFLLVFGTMRGFLAPNAQKFMSNLLRATLIVCLIGNWHVIKQWTEHAADGLCRYQIQVNFQGIAQGAQQTTVRLDIAQIRQMIDQKVTQKASGPTFWDWFTNPVGTAAQQMTAFFSSLIAHPLAAVLWGMYFLTLFLCEWIIVIMDFLQRAIIIFLDLYVPIALAEFSVQSMQSQATAFFRTYLGVYCWPVGWVFANLVTLALLQALSAPNQDDPGQILTAIVWSIPILLWVVIGHVIAPLYAQKVVARGGAELQAFTGAMVAAVGGTTGATYAGALRFGAGKLRGFDESIANPKKNNEAGSGAGQESSSSWASVPEFTGSKSNVGPSGRQVRGISGWARGLIGTGAELGAKASDFTAGVSETSGNLAGTMGSMIANASGYRLGPEGNFRFGSVRRSEPNRSSQRARSYLN
jgi:hypothetical protein